MLFDLLEQKLLNLHELGVQTSSLDEDVRDGVNSFQEEFAQELVKHFAQRMV